MLSIVVIQAEQTLLSKLLMKVPSEWGGAEQCVWRMGMGKGAAHTTCNAVGGEKERPDEKDKRASIPSSPAWALTISPARTQRCSWAPRGTSWCLPSYPGAPTRFCGKAGVIEWVWCGVEESQSLSNSLHGNLHGLRIFFFSNKKMSALIIPALSVSLALSCSLSPPPLSLMIGQKIQFTVDSDLVI